MLDNKNSHAFLNSHKQKKKKNRKAFNYSLLL